MTELAQRSTCLRCGGHTVRPMQRPARTVSYRVFAALPLPTDLALPTCSRCHAGCLDPETTGRLRELLPRLYEAELRRLAGKELRALAPYISQRQLELLAGLAQDGMKRLAHHQRGGHNSTNTKVYALRGAKRWRPAMFFIGIDVHKKHSQICILTEQGEPCLEMRALTMRADLSDVLGRYLPARIVLESSTPSEWVARHLESMGFEVIVADPGFAPMYATRDKKLKTDKRDARALAQAAKLGAYKLAHHLSDEQRALRIQIQSRHTLVQMRTKIINQIGAILLAQGLRVQTGDAEYYARRVQAVQMPPELGELIAPLLSMMGPLNERIAQLDEELAKRSKSDEQAERLQQIPGVGPIISLMFLAVLDGADRFEGQHQVMSYLGLVPREKSSGEKQLRGHITKAGNGPMRVLLVQAAVGIMRLKKPQTVRLHEWAEKIAQRRGKRIATVALARRLAGVMWAMLRDGTEYQAEPVKPGRVPKDPIVVQPGSSLAA